MDEPISEAARTVVCFESFAEDTFLEGTDECIVQSMFKAKEFYQGSTPMRDNSLMILESQGSIEQLLSLVAISKTAGKSIAAEKAAQVSICDWYIETWMQRYPGFCMDEK